MTTAERLARYEDLFGLPDNVVGEIIAGHLFTHPRQAPAYARASAVPSHFSDTGGLPDGAFRHPRGKPSARIVVHHAILQSGAAGAIVALQ
ncbi:hypothetical protein NR402_16735 [Acidithiobacillus ferrooxidans]|uniref:hypothetical protein n=1 Tax=Acidithiobacillus ferrooxidans TaxID=920 RepID=UPI00214CBD3F|nr:hypothetical protein [Acidithiobacillus ferrooxidans]MCR2831903.1 hypothetical protein [Acidithiobacillus ferrooxidans]